jgi:4-diphosphocytidyl-2-C-methyl-D-erythritol kinase
MQVRACAKTNLYLAVTGRRGDGYHDIESLFVPLPGLSDQVTVERDSRGLRVDCDQEGVPTDAANLAGKAAAAACRKWGVAPDVRIHIEKRIPVAAGLGGGSSDAAAVLRALPALFDREYDAGEALETARNLGADVPFFLQQTACIAHGIGDRLTPVKARPLPLLLVNPGFPVATPWAYSVVKPSPGPGIGAMVEAIADGDPGCVADASYNAFEPGVFRKFPILQLLAESTVAAGALAARLSGSGPTLLVFLPEAASGAAVEDALRRKFDAPLWCWHGESGPGQSQV